MRLTIKATNIEHSNAIDTYLAKKMAEVDRILDPKEKSQIARLDVGKTSKHHKEGKGVFYAEITFHVKKKEFRAVAKAGDLYEAIDKMKSMVTREINRHHEQLRSLEKRGKREIKRRVNKSKTL